MAPSISTNHHYSGGGGIAPLRGAQMVCGCVWGGGGGGPPPPPPTTHTKGLAKRHRR
jgi:hypothetical protein